MRRLSRTMRMTGRFLADERGATAIEYAMVAGSVALVVAAAIYNLGSVALTNMYNKIVAVM